MSPEVDRANPRRRAAARAWARAFMIGVALAGGVASPGALDAQAPGRGNGPDRAELEQRVRAQMGRMMRERLGLDEEQATRLADVVRDFDGRRRELFRLEQATQRRVEALLLEGVDDEAEARDLMDRMAELRVQEAELFAAERRDRGSRGPGRGAYRDAPGGPRRGPVPVPADRVPLG
jgi:Spy/CpxP family protein refolding chaperone